MKNLTEQLNIKKFLVAHSYTLTTPDIVIDALPKVLEYIESRRVKDEELEIAVNVNNLFIVFVLLEIRKIHIRRTLS